MADDATKLFVSVEARTDKLEKALARVEAQNRKWKASVDQTLRGTQAQFQRTSDVAARSLARIEKQSSTSASAIAASFKGLGAGLAAGFSAQAFAKFADTSTRIENGLKVVGIEGKNLTATYQKLGRIALDNGASFEAVAGLYGRVTKASKELGATSAEVLEFTRRVAVGLKASGTDAQQASAGIMQLNQALASGVLRGDEFNSVAENLPVVAEAIAKGMGVTVGRLRELAAEGALDARTVFTAFMKGSADLDAQAAKTSTTFSQAFQNIGTALVMAAGEFNKTTGASQAFADIVNNAVVPAITGLGEAISTTNEKHAALGKQLQDFAQRWGIEGAVLDAVQAFKDLGNVTDPLLAAFQAAQAQIRAARGALKQDFDGVADDFAAAMQSLKDAGQADVASTLSAGFVDLAAKIGTGTAEAKDFDGVIKGLIDSGNQMADAVAGRLEIISGKFANAGEAAKKAFDDAGKALAAALGENALSIVDALAGRLGDRLPESVARFTGALKDALVMLGRLDSASANVLTQISAGGFQPGDLTHGGQFLNFATGNETPTNSPDYIPLPDSTDATPTPRQDPFFGDATGGRGTDKVKQAAERAADKLKAAIARQTDVAVDAAATLIGQSETANAGSINAFLRRGGVDIDAARTAWCAGFVNSALAQVGVKGTGSNVATDFLAWGQAVDLASIQRGDVLVDPNGKRAGQTGGHVGFATGQLRVTAQGISQIEMLSGNASDKVQTDWVDASEVVARRATDAFQVPADALRNLTDQSASAKSAVDVQAQAYEELGNIASNALQGIAGALADGKIEGRELAQILLQLAQQLLSMPNLGGILSGATAGAAGASGGVGGQSIGGGFLGTILSGLGALFGFADGGEVARPAGGPVFGPGGGRDDKIAAKLSNGEFVVNSRATRRNLPILRRINAGIPLPDELRLADGGSLARLMDRPVDTPAAKAGRLAFQRHDYDRPSVDALDIGVTVDMDAKGKWKGFVTDVSRATTQTGLSRYDYAKRNGGAAADNHRYRRLKRDA